MTEFKSQICATVEQSNRLLGLGLKKETADMCHIENKHYYNSTEYKVEFFISPIDGLERLKENQIPAWSLGRLLALVNGEDWRAEITLKDERYGIHYGYESYWYDDIFEAVIAWIEDDIKEGYFNKEYLQEQSDSRREG